MQGPLNYYRDSTPHGRGAQEVLDRHANGERIKRLLAIGHAYAWQREGPEYTQLGQLPTGWYEWPGGLGPLVNDGLLSPVQRLVDRLGQADRAGIVVPDHLHLVHDVAETNVGLRVGEADRAASPPCPNAPSWTIFEPSIYR